MQGRSLGLVPTMGALHKGHLSLMQKARQQNDVLTVSIFVNPVQFGPHEDLEQYPRDMAGDIEKIEAVPVDILFNPGVKDIYPEGYSTYVEVERMSNALCGMYRPGHFKGVTTVVTKLFNIIRPTRAYFGQKDYQQSAIIRKLVKDLNMDIDLVVCPTIREPDGLAMSSRNSYLSPKQRDAAAVIYATLTLGKNLITEGHRDAKAVQEAMLENLKKEPLIEDIDYVAIVDTETLSPIEHISEQVLLAIAIRIGKTRLIDNIIV